MMVQGSGNIKKKKKTYLVALQFWIVPGKLFNIFALGSVNW